MDASSRREIPRTWQEGRSTEGNSMKCHMHEDWGIARTVREDLQENFGDLVKRGKVSL